MSKRIDLSRLPLHIGATYPEPHDRPCLTRERRRRGNAAGLTQFGVNLLRLPPGVWSSQRHWHQNEDEFTYVLAGEVVLVTNEGEEVFRAGDCAGFKAGDANGHHFQNRSSQDVLLLEIGTRSGGDAVDYPDTDLTLPPGGDYSHKDGTPYPPRRARKAD